MIHTFLELQFESHGSQTHNRHDLVNYDHIFADHHTRDLGNNAPRLCSLSCPVS